MPQRQEQFDFCVLIPCFNNFQGLIKSLNSIHYPAPNYFIVIVDDGSDTPVTIQNVTANFKESANIEIIQFEKNKGITDALNAGLKWIEENLQTKYIARLDCSDICAPQRFYEQVRYLERHPNVGLLGSWCYFKEENTSFSYEYTTPTEYEEIKKVMYSRNVFIHPTVMFRRALLKKVGYYPYEFPHAEDYALFWKMMNEAEAKILDQFLVTCAINSNGISFSNRKQQLISRKKVISAFGKSSFLKFIGHLKVNLLLFMPNKLILNLKSLKSKK